jgi:hypothetical protein
MCEIKITLLLADTVYALGRKHKFFNCFDLKNYINALFIKQVVNNMRIPFLGVLLVLVSVAIINPVLAD